MTSLPATGVVSYNGVEFGPMTQTLGIDATPVYDQAGRTVVYIVYKITIKTYLQASGGLDDTLDELRKRLLAPAAELHYDDKGFGAVSLSVNAGDIKDVMWGPRPTMLSWKPLGDDKAAEIVWAVEVAIPECDNAKYAFRPMEFNFRVQFAVDEAGYTRRTYSGHLRIPQTRRTARSRRLSDSADKYRDQVVPKLPEGFRRTTRTWDVDESKCKLTFQIVDEQMGQSIPPPGVVRVEASEAIQSLDKIPSVGVRWACVLNADYELARDGRAKIADILAHFGKLFEDRTKKAKDAKDQAIPSRLDIREPEIYGRNHVQVSVAWTLITSFEKKLNPKDAAAKAIFSSGLWRPVPDSNWQKWSQSLAATALHPRGFAGLEFGPDQDAIVDLCMPDRAVLLPGRAPAGGAVPPPPPGASVLNVEPPRPETSWLEYVLQIGFTEGDGVSTLEPLPRHPLFPVTEGSGSSGGDFVNPFGNANVISSNPASPAQLLLNSVAGPRGGAITSYTTKPPKTIVQRRTKGTLHAILRGMAVRAGYPIVCPRLVSVGGVKAIPAQGRGTGFRTHVVANWLGVPIVGAAWRLRYILPEAPQQLSPLTRG